MISIIGYQKLEGNMMRKRAVLLDTSFFLRFLNDNDPLFKNADGYFRRKIIPNDAKLFAQADCEKTVEYYLTSDTRSFKVYNAIKNKTNPKFQFLDLNIPHHQAFGVLDL